MKSVFIKSEARRSPRLPRVAFLLVPLFCLISTIAVASEKWSGVDESVVEKYAEEYGRQARDPIINTDQGDLLLFVFLVAGVIGGFVAGYYFRALTADSEPSATEEKQRVTG